MSQHLPEWFDETRWVPPPGSIGTRRVTAFMQRHGLQDYQSLLRRAASEPQWFYPAAFSDLGLLWMQPFQTVVDDSEGQARARWFVGGRTNVAFLTCSRWAHKARPALLWEGDDGSTREVTFAELDDAVSRAAAGLRSLGVNRGDVVAIHAPMLPEAVMALLATARIGAIAMPLFSGYGRSALVERLQLSQAKVMVSTDGFLRGGKTFNTAELLSGVLSACPLLNHVVTIPRLGATVAGAVDWRDLTSRGLDPPPEDFGSDTPFLLVFTSGSTGSPKGAVHVHGGLAYRLAIEMAYNLDVHELDRFTWITDMGWIMGPVSTLGPLSLGATAVMFEGAPNHPDAGRLWRFVARHGISHLGVSPTLVRVLSASGGEHLGPELLASLRVIGITGEPCTPPVWRWLHRFVGQGRRPVINWTGGAEIGSGILIGCPVVEMQEGRFAGPTPGLSVEVFDENGQSVIGQLGELVLTRSSPTMSKGLWKQPDRYLETYWSRWPDVWVHGDRAIRYADGSWEVPGRSDDVIKVGGKRVGPAEFETVANHLDGVVAAAAVGVPHRTKGQTAVMAVVPKDPSVDHRMLASTVLECIAEALGKPLKPSAVLVVPELPLTMSNKVHRRVLRCWLTGEDPGDLINLVNPQARAGVETAARKLEIENLE